MATKYSNTIKIKTGQGDTGFEDVKISYIGKNSTTEEGIGTKAVIAGQHVEGKYNQPVSAITSNGKANNVLHVAGNGTDDKNRSNAYILTEGGEGVYAGGIVTTNLLLTSTDEVQKLLNGNSYPDVDKTTSLNETLGEFAQTLKDNVQNLETYNAQYNKFVNETYKDYTVKIEQQMDGGGNTWYYSEAQMNAEMATWNTNALKNEHMGDLWYNTDTDKSYIYTTKHTWSEVKQGISQALFDTTDSKARLFTERPCNDALKVTQAYNVNDLWILNVDNPGGGQAYYPPYREGTLLVATTAKAVGSTYSPDDWTEKVKYSNEIANLQNQVDRRLETWYQSEAPEFSDAEKNNHVGDYWYNTKNKEVKKYILDPKTKQYEWGETEDQISMGLFDLTDGKSTVYTVIDANTMATARPNDLLIPTSNFTYDNVKYSIGKVYRYDGSSWNELAYTDVQGVQNAGGIFTGQTIGDTNTSTQIREDGVLYATGANITGTITAIDGEFTGAIKCGDLQGTSDGKLTSTGTYSKNSDANVLPKPGIATYLNTTEKLQTVLDKGYLQLENTTNLQGDPSDLQYDLFMYPYYLSLQSYDTESNIFTGGCSRQILDLSSDEIKLATSKAHNAKPTALEFTTHFQVTPSQLIYKPLGTSSEGLSITKNTEAEFTWNGSKVLTNADAPGLSVKYAATALDATTATTATKATQDGQGRVISDTYLPLAGGTMTGALNMETGTKITFNNGASWIDNYGDDYIRFGLGQNDADYKHTIILTRTGIFRPFTAPGEDTPGASVDFSLGKESAKWDDLYTVDAHIDNLSADNLQSGYYSLTDNNKSVAANSYTDITITFPKAFSAEPHILLTLKWNVTEDYENGLQIVVAETGVTGFKARIYNHTRTERKPGFSWMAHL